MPTQDLGNPPVRDRIVDKNGIPTQNFAKWLSVMTSLFLTADAVVDSTVSVTSANASDLATAITLANELKADLNTLTSDLNGLITKLRDAGVTD